MKILLTGATGYIGRNLLPVLIEQGHEVICCVRDRKKLPALGIYNHKNVSVIEIDFLNDLKSQDLFDEKMNYNEIKDIDVAYYLIHSMSENLKDFSTLEEIAATNFLKLISQTSIKQIIYLSGIINEEKLSKHLSSRKRVEEILASSGIPLTTIRAGIIVGSGSASFEIIKDLVEKLPVMVAPKWVNTRIQPIAVKDILEFLKGVLLKPETFNKSYDVGGPDILTYKEMLLKYAKVRGLKRLIITVPVMTPRLSSYWLYFMTSVPYKLAVSLVNSMKVEVVAKDNELAELLGIKPISYEEAVRLAIQTENAN